MDARNRSFTEMDRAKRAARIMAMRAQAHSLTYIGDEVGLSHVQVLNIIREEIRKSAIPVADELRKRESMQLDALEEIALKILEKNHIIVQQGKVVRMGDEPIEDSGPILDAIATILKVHERRAKLLGLDMPTKIEAQIYQETEQDRALAELVREAKAAQANEEAALAGENTGQVQSPTS